MCVRRKCLFFHTSCRRPSLLYARRISSMPREEGCGGSSGCRFDGCCGDGAVPRPIIISSIQLKLSWLTTSSWLRGGEACRDRDHDDDVRCLSAFSARRRSMTTINCRSAHRSCSTVKWGTSGATYTSILWRSPRIRTAIFFLMIKNVF